MLILHPPLTMDSQQIRAQCRSGQFTGPTPGYAPGYIQANMVILPADLALDFWLFCQRNPKPCPILDVCDRGNPHPPLIAPHADVRTDLPRYRLFEQGEFIQELTDISHLWQDDWVTFLVGCSFSFEAAMERTHLPVRHIEEGKNVPMYRTNLPCIPGGRFHGNLVVSMRPLTPAQAITAIEVTSPFTKAHGAPIHLGDPNAIGIQDINQPDFGDRVTINPGEIPVFWACGVTTQLAVANAKPAIAISHAPGCMFVSDLKEEDVTRL